MKNKIEYIDLQEFMSLNKIKGKELSDYLGVSTGFVSSILHGRRSIPEEHIGKLFTNPFGWDVAMLKKVELAESSIANIPDNIVIPREVWKLIESKDRQMDEMVSSLKIKDQQTSEVITILKESIDMLKSEIDKKGDGVAEVGRVAPRAAGG